MMIFLSFTIITAIGFMGHMIWETYLKRDDLNLIEYSDSPPRMVEVDPNPRRLHIRDGQQ